MIINYLRRKSTRNEYIIAYRAVGEEQTLLKNNVPSSYKVIQATDRWWYADPLLFTDKESVYCFMEAYDRKKDIGRIAVSEYKNGGFTDPLVILEENFHLSFPFVFSKNGNVYMIPETSSIGEIRIYKAENSLYNWKLVKTIDCEGAVDTCLWNYDDKDYLITSIIGEPAVYTKEKILVLDDLFNVYECNNIFDDVMEGYGARNGGRIIELEGQCYLPKQVSLPPDKYGIYLDGYVLSNSENGIVRTKTAKIETNVIQIDNYPINYQKLGVHTYDYKSGVEVVDLNINTIRLINLFREARNEIKRRFRGIK